MRWFVRGVRELEEGAALMVSLWLTPFAVSMYVSNVVDIFNATAGTWSTAALSVGRGYLAVTSLPNAGLAFFAGGGGYSNVVDIFNATAGTWSTAALSVGRGYLAATSLPSAGLAFFAGGSGTCLLCLFELMRDAIVCEGGCVSWRRALR